MMSTTEPVWRRSTYSGGQGGNCVEWAPTHASGGVVPVRDSKDTSRTSLRFSTGAWASFVEGVQGEQFDA